MPTLDPTEAPEGYHAVLKAEARIPSPNGGGYRNLCEACDWRPTCRKTSTDLKRHKHRCSGYAVILSDGRELCRNDGCSVVFKANNQQGPTAKLRKEKGIEQ